MAQEGATEACFGLPYLFCEVWDTEEHRAQEGAPEQGIIAPPELPPLAWHNSLQGPDGVVDLCSGDTQVYYGLPHLFFEVLDTDEHGTKHMAQEGATDAELGMEGIAPPDSILPGPAHR